MDRTDSLPPEPSPAPAPPPAVEVLELPDDEPAAPPRPPAKKPRRPIPPTPGRVLFTIAAGFVIVFLFLRTFVLEPFGVPTGSMAPTLLGNHRAAPCPRCGYAVRVGIPSDNRPRPFADAVCPNCGKPVDLSRAAEINGDRLLVDKNVYNLRRPRRWEVAVFHCPDPRDLLKPYVKRVVGLPGERIEIIDGDVYADGQLARKGLAEAREARIPVFDMTAVPKPGGWGPRWVVYPPGQDTRPAEEPAAADAAVVTGPELVLDATAGQDVRVEYRHRNLDTGRDEAINSWNSYDGGARSSQGFPAVHDFFVSCTVEVTAAPADGLLALRLFDGLDSVAAEIPVGTGSAARTRLAQHGQGVLAESAAGRAPLAPGKVYHLEFAFVDRRASLAVEGNELVPAADLPAVPKRGEVTRPLQLGARGCRVVVRELRLSRDVHYTQAGTHGTQTPAVLGRGDYFVLGDNSGNSQDSREWPSPGVPEDAFIGKPFLIHQPLKVGRVAVGGSDRVFQTLDWSRLRWVH